MELSFGIILKGDKQWQKLQLSQVLLLATKVAFIKSKVRVVV